jgi:putative hemolysin
MSLYLPVIVVLIIFSGLFSGTETAFTSLSFLQIKEMEDDRRRRVRTAARLAKKSDLLLTTILIGNNLVNIAASALLTSYTIATYGNYAVGYATGILTLLILIFAEITPKQIAIVHNRRISSAMAYPIQGLTVLLYPLVHIIKGISSSITRLFVHGTHNPISLAGILHVMDIAQDQGVVDEYESTMVQKVFRFDDIDVHTIMTHRTSVFSLDGSMTLSDALPPIMQSGFSRIPVYQESPEHIIGVLLARDLIYKVLYESEQQTVAQICMDPIFVPETRKVNEMFLLFKHHKLHLAIVLDEYGGLAGVVTLEDIIEELFGELYDEHESGATERIAFMGDMTYSIMGETPIQQVEDYFSIDIEHSRHVGTIGGYITEFLGTIPEEKQIIDTEWGIFKISSMTGNRINSITFMPITAPD